MIRLLAVARSSARGLAGGVGRCRLTAYKIVSANSVPDVPHLTLLDKYVVACTVFSALVACQNGLASTALADAGDGEFDRISGLAVFGAWVLFNVYTLLRWQ